jgi:iojap-like protein
VTPGGARKPVTYQEKAAEIVRVLDNKKALNIQAIRVGEVTVLADCFIIASTTNPTHVKALADEVEFQLKERFNVVPDHIEGYQAADWIVMDYGDVVVHIFHEKAREYYSLEKLWSDGTPMEVASLLEQS